MEKFYFTFGQKYPVLRNKYVELEGDWEHCRKKILNSIIGQRFAFQYSEEDFEGQPFKYGLMRIALSNVTKSMFVEEVEEGFTDSGESE